MDGPIWTPSPERVGASRLKRFMEEVGHSDYASLHGWSVDRPEEFWSALWDFVGVVARREPDQVVEAFDRMPGARWFPGAELNFAENLLRFEDDRPALVAWNEKGRGRSLTYRQLRLEVGALAGAMEREGIQPGDRVAGVVANVPEAVTAMLAATSLGAVWSSCSPDFGSDGAIDRLGQIHPRILFASAGYVYGGKRYDCFQRLAAICRSIDSIERVVVIPSASEPDLRGLRSARLYDEYVGKPMAPSFKPLPFGHPAYILYTSGTTGPPKCIVHSAGGTLLQHLKELALHSDLQCQACIFFFTSCGWMMWNWLVSGLALGSKIVLYDGSPFCPHPGSLFDLIDSERISIFGVGAKYISAVEKSGLEPGRSHSLASLRTILSTGSPLSPSSFDFVYGKIKRDVHLASISGGTDIVSCFALGNPTRAVYRGELQAPGLGMRVDVFGDDGVPLPVGATGELVCTQPFPAMPLGFWNDSDGRKYREAYFERFPGVWHHGDLCERRPSGGFRIWGRSDTVLNPGGVRIGTAEIYNAVEAMPEIAEAVAVGFQRGGDEQVVLLVVLTNDAELDDRLVADIKQTILRRASPRHVPAAVLQVDDIPRTRSGKVAELAVKRVLAGRSVPNTMALANPDTLDAYKRMRDELLAR
ncbi:MAG: acetoacetate--CoA ligase [Acidobacteriia bacterium]|nr:acetoacetate--CoA ligase [Terriglobia bacterium]